MGKYKPIYILTLTLFNENQVFLYHNLNSLKESLIHMIYIKANIIIARNWLNIDSY